MFIAIVMADFTTFMLCIMIAVTPVAAAVTIIVRTATGAATTISYHHSSRTITNRAIAVVK